MIYNDRTPFILKRMDDPTLIENELFINPHDGIVYIFKNEGGHVGISYMRIYEAIRNALSKYVGNMTPDQIQELINKSNELYKWMEDSNDDTVNTPESNILNIFRVFDGYDSNNTLKNLISNMIDKEEGKSLVSNSFELDHILKINSIMENANFYAHPETLQCNLGSKVESIIINGETRQGDVIISKEDIGYGGVEYGANKYEHPRKQQCAAGVVSINNMKGYVELEKKHFRINNLPNVPPATYRDYDNKSDNVLFLSNTAVEHLNNKLTNIINSNPTPIVSQYKVEFTANDKTQIRSVDIGGVTHSEFDSNDKMIFDVYHNNVTVSVIDRRRENIIIQNVSGLRKNTPTKIHYTKGGILEIV